MEEWNISAVTVGLGLVTSVLVLAWLYTRRDGRLPPGPAGLPFLGSLDILGPDMWLRFQEMSRRYGDIFSFYMGSRLTIVLNSSQAIREAFIKQNVTFAGRPRAWVMQLVGVQEVINNGTYSEEWKVERKFILYALRKFGYGSASLEDRMKHELNMLLNVFEASNGEAVDPRLHLPKTLANLVFSILVNESYDFESEDLRRKLYLIQKWQGTVGEANLLDMFPILRFIPWAPMKRLKDVKMEITAEFRKHVKEHKETFNPDHCRDVIDVYLKDRGDDFDTEKLVGMFFSFVGDAVDSLPEAIVWILLYVTAHDKVQNKVQEEILQVTSGEREVVLADRSSMPYTEAVIMEGLRMSSFVPVSEPHSTLEDTTLMGYHIPKHSCVLASLYAAHMEDAAWGDPDVFRPDRFVDQSGNITRQDAFMPFSVGRRVCLGEQLSNKILFLFTASILQRFHLRFPTDATPPSLAAPSGYVRKAPPYTLCVNPR